MATYKQGLFSVHATSGLAIEHRQAYLFSSETRLADNRRATRRYQCI